jgi:hypothetical protein
MRGPYATSPPSGNMMRMIFVSDENFNGFRE